MTQSYVKHQPFYEENGFIIHCTIYFLLNRNTSKMYFTYLFYHFTISPFHHFIIYFGIMSPFHHFAVIMFHYFTICCGITSPFHHFNTIPFQNYTITPLHSEITSQFHHFTIAPLNNQTIATWQHKTLEVLYDCLESWLEISNY